MAEEQPVFTKCPACDVECYAWRDRCPTCNKPLPHARPDVLTYDEFVTLLRQVVKSVPSMREWCKANDLFVGNVSEMSRGKRKLSAKIAKVLGYRMDIRFIRERQGDA